MDDDPIAARFDVFDQLPPPDNWERSVARSSTARPGPFGRATRISSDTVSLTGSSGETIGGAAFREVSLVVEAEVSSWLVATR